MNNNNLNTQTSGNSIDEVNINFSDFKYEANLVRNNYISSHFTTLINANDLSSNGQYDLRDFMPEENISCHASSIDVDLDFDQDMSTVENNVSCNVFDKCVKIVNKNMIERAAINALMSHYKMDTLLKSEYTVRPETYDMCQEGCICFDNVEAGQNADAEEQCPH
ncbi:hypothetical protein F4703DRAFT_1930715 [Phycomyces blakesleeanus]